MQPDTDQQFQQWLKQYQFFFFDFDGLLVNTEQIHYLAYKKMVSDRGLDLTWSFSRYCQAAHYEADALRDQVYTEFPQLSAIDWKVLYNEKKQALADLIAAGAIQLMPGVQQILSHLKNRLDRCCVVTHSPVDIVHLVRQQHPLLLSIPNWVTRHDYSLPKPDPECYKTALHKMGYQSGDRAVGFEDTPRGIRALLQTPIDPVLITQIDYPEIEGFLKLGVTHYHTLNDLMSSSNPSQGGCK